MTGDQTSDARSNWLVQPSLANARAYVGTVVADEEREERKVFHALWCGLPHHERFAAGMIWLFPWESYAITRGALNAWASLRVGTRRVPTSLLTFAQRPFPSLSRQEVLEAEAAVLRVADSMFSVAEREAGLAPKSSLLAEFGYALHGLAMAARDLVVEEDVQGFAECLTETMEQLREMERTVDRMRDPRLRQMTQGVTVNALRRVSDRILKGSGRMV